MTTRGLGVVGATGMRTSIVLDWPAVVTLSVTWVVEYGPAALGSAGPPTSGTPGEGVGGAADGGAVAPGAAAPVGAAVAAEDEPADEPPPPVPLHPSAPNGASASTAMIDEPRLPLNTPSTRAMRGSHPLPMTRGARGQVNTRLSP